MPGAATVTPPPSHRYRRTNLSPPSIACLLRLVASSNPLPLGAGISIQCSSSACGVPSSSTAPLKRRVTRAKARLSLAILEKETTFDGGAQTAFALRKLNDVQPLCLFVDEMRDSFVRTSPSSFAEAGPMPSYCGSAEPR